MKPGTKQLLIKLAVYVIIGFACAFFWNKFKAS